jgi:hypothetical protein
MDNIGPRLLRTRGRIPLTRGFGLRVLCLLFVHCFLSCRLGLELGRRQIIMVKTTEGGIQVLDDLGRLLEV